MVSENTVILVQFNRGFLWDAVSWTTDSPSGRIPPCWTSQTCQRLGRTRDVGSRPGEVAFRVIWPATVVDWRIANPRPR